MQNENGISPSNHRIDEWNLEPTNKMMRYRREIDMADKRRLLFNGDMHQQLNKNKFPEFSFDPSRLVPFVYFHYSCVNLFLLMDNTASKGIGKIFKLWNILFLK